MPECTVGMEGMSDEAQSAGWGSKPRLVEVGRKREVPRTEVPCPKNPHVRELSWRMSRIEAVVDERGVLIVEGVVTEDTNALSGERETVTFGDLGYSGSHDLIEGYVATHADLCALAKRMNRALDECMEKFVEERTGNA